MLPNTQIDMWQFIVIVIQAAIALAGFLGALMINRLIKAVDALAEADGQIHERLTAYREDMLRNYVRNEQLEPIKKDLIGRIDRMEISFKEALMDHEHRELRMYQMRGSANG